MLIGQKKRKDVFLRGKMGKNGKRVMSTFFFVHIEKVSLNIFRKSIFYILLNFLHFFKFIFFVIFFVYIRKYNLRQILVKITHNCIMFARFTDFIFFIFGFIFFTSFHHVFSFSSFWKKNLKFHFLFHFFSFNFFSFFSSFCLR